MWRAVAAVVMGWTAMMLHAEEQPFAAPSKAVRAAMSCIHWDTPWVLNGCDARVFVQWCFFANSGHPLTCGSHARPHHTDPKLKVGFYTHAMGLRPGDEFKAPWTDEYEFSWVACPSRPGGSGFYYAVSSGENRFKCIRVERTILKQAVQVTRHDRDAWNNVLDARLEQELLEEEEQWQAQRHRVAEHEQIWGRILKTLLHDSQGSSSTSPGSGQSWCMVHFGHDDCKAIN